MKLLMPAIILCLSAINLKVSALPESYAVNYLPGPAVSINILGNYLINESNKPVVRSWTDDSLIQQWTNTGSMNFGGVDLNDNNQVAATLPIFQYGDFNGAYRLDPHPTNPDVGSWVRFQSGQTDAVAYGMNDSGVVVGEYREFGSSTRDAFSGVGTIGSIVFSCCFARVGGKALGISNGGLVVGYKEVNYNSFDRRHAFIIGPGIGIQSINASVGYATGSGTAKDVNDNGLVVGEITNSNFLTATNRLPYIWDSQTNIISLLPGLPNGSTTSLPATVEINNQNTVIGMATDTNGKTQGVVWENNAIIELNTLVPSLSNDERINRTIDITDNGDILVTIINDLLSQTRYAVLTPELNSCASQFPLGDINLDCEVNKGDAILLNRYILGVQNLDSSQLANADLLTNGVVDLGDFILLERMLLGL